MRKTISLVLTAALLCLAAAGCGSAAAPASAETASPETEETEIIETTPEPVESTEPGPSEEPGTEPEETEEPELPSAPDFELGRDYFPADMVVMRVEDVEIPWAWYFTEVQQYALSFYQYYGISEYDMELGDDGETFGDLLREEAESELKSYAMMFSWAEELGLSLSEEDNEDIQTQIQETADENFDGDRDALFEAIGVSEDFMVSQWQASLLSQKIMEYYFGEEGEELSDEDAAEYLLDKDWMYAKHILFKTVDDAGDPLSEEEIAEKRAAAEEVLEQLKDAEPEELPELFDQLMKDRSEDPGAISYPDGYYFQAGEMVSAFEDAARGLEEDHFTEIVESNYGFHILYRPAISGDHIFSVSSNGTETVRQYVAEELFNNMASERYEALAVEYAEGFTPPSLTELFFGAAPVAEDAEAEEAMAETEDAETEEPAEETGAEDAEAEESEAEKEPVEESGEKDAKTEESEEEPEPETEDTDTEESAEESEAEDDGTEEPEEKT